MVSNQVDLGAHTASVFLAYDLQQPAFLSMISFHFLSIVITIMIYKKNFPGNSVKLLFIPREGGGAMVKTFVEGGDDVPTLWV